MILFPILILLIALHVCLYIAVPFRDTFMVSFGICVTKNTMCKSTYNNTLACYSALALLVAPTLIQVSEQERAEVSDMAQILNSIWKVMLSKVYPWMW